MDLGFFEGENFDCYAKFKSLGLVKFMSLRKPIYPDLVKMFYSNLEIRDNFIVSEVKKIPIYVDGGLFFHLTGLSSEGDPCVGFVPDDWKLDYNVEDAKKMICNEGANLSGRILAGALGLDNRLMHYVYVRTLCPKLHNIAQLTEGDVVIGVISCDFI